MIQSFCPACPKQTGTKGACENNAERSFGKAEKEWVKSSSVLNRKLNNLGLSSQKSLTFLPLLLRGEHFPAVSALGHSYYLNLPQVTSYHTTAPRCLVPWTEPPTPFKGQLCRLLPGTLHGFPCGAKSVHIILRYTPQLSHF